MSGSFSYDTNLADQGAAPGAGFFQPVNFSINVDGFTVVDNGSEIQAHIVSPRTGGNEFAVFSTAFPPAAGVGGLEFYSAGVILNSFDGIALSSVDVLPDAVPALVEWELPLLFLAFAMGPGDPDARPDDTAGVVGTVDSLTRRPIADPLAHHSAPVSGPGSSAAEPYLPITTVDGFEFTDVPAGAWVDSPATSAFAYTMTSSSLFTYIEDFPTGFADPFNVFVDGTLLGQFGPGQFVDFTGFAGGGVSSFVVSGINPLVDAGDPSAFPLRLSFNTPTADFTMVAQAAVPEPTAAVMWLLPAAIYGCFHRRVKGMRSFA